MRSFFKIFFATLLAMIAFSFIAFFFVVAMVTAAASSDKPSIGSNAVLLLDLSVPLPEQAVDDPIAKLTGSGLNGPGLYDVVRMLHYAKTDDNVKGLVIKAEANAMGFAGSQMIRKAILDFRSSKKFVIAYGENISQKSYFVASAAQKIYCHPQGGLEWKGLSANIMFIKNLLNKLEIEPQIFYAGKFKSATEPLRETQMTEANRIQTKAFLTDMFSNVLMAASAARNIDTLLLKRFADSALLETAQDAVRYKMIDGARYDDEVKSEILKLTGESPSKEKINFVGMETYSEAVNFRRTGSENRIAIIYAEGNIIDGKKQDMSISSEEYKNLFRKVRLDKKVKAVVFRVNSPGGSALASDIIWREVELTKKVKPVVVSFGDYAASGGYYVACGANKIYAEATTLTGSIGVFGIVPNLKGLFNNKLGITFDGVKTNTYADMGELSRPLTPGEKRLFQSSVDTVYAVFKNRVAKGRKLPKETVDSIAQGRVWTGSAALKIGLVDALGGMKEAIAAAADLARIDDYSTREYPQKENFLDKILNSSKEKTIKANLVISEIGLENYLLFKKVNELKTMMRKPQARLPFEFEIQ